MTLPESHAVVTHRRSQRGSGMLLAIIVVMVLAVIGVGMLRFTSRELAGADAGRKHEALVACADTARQLLLSQFRASGVSPLELQALNVQLDTDQNTFARGGHIGEDPPGSVTIGQVSLLNAADEGVESTGDITNTPLPQLAQKGGKPYLVVTHCSDHDREIEVEFRVRFGL